MLTIRSAVQNFLPNIAGPLKIAKDVADEGHRMDGWWIVVMVMVTSGNDGLKTETVLMESFRGKHAGDQCQIRTGEFNAAESSGGLSSSGRKVVSRVFDCTYLPYYMVDDR